MNINVATLIGRTTKAPELKALPSGTKVVSFGLATNNVYKDKDGQKQETTTFHNIVAFGKMAETIAQYVVKGQELYVTGRIENRSWEKDGVKHNKTEIIADTFQFGAKPKGMENAPRQEEEPAGMAEEFPEEEISVDDIPF